MSDGLPAIGPLLPQLLLPRRRPDWRSAGRVEVGARGVWLDPARVDAFLRTCGGCEPPQLPLTFPYALVTPLHLAVLASPAFPLPVVGLLHREEHIVRRRTMAVGTRADVVVAVDAFRELPSGVGFDLHTTLTQGGEVVWTSRSTMVRRVGRAPQRAVQTPEDTGGGVVIRVPAGEGRRYAWVSRNFDPIHVSTVGARLLGHPRALVHGMWTVARCVAELSEPTGAAELDVRFRSPLYAPDEAWLRSVNDGQDTSFHVVGTKGQRVLEGTLRRVASDTAAGQATVRSMRR